MNKELPEIIAEIKTKFPFAEIFAFEDKNQIYISHLRIPKEKRRRGVGRDIIGSIKDYAYEKQKPVVLSPEAERGYKSKLEKFYKKLGFVDNAGRNKDYSLSRFAPTMYWRPRKFVEYVEKRDNDKKS